jgi:hypothetical protein
MNEEANYGILAVGQVYKGYSDLCKHLGVDDHKSGSGAKNAQLTEWARYFKFKKCEIEGRKRKGIIITKVYDKPLPIPLKRAVYANEIRELILTWLANSKDCKIIYSQKALHETLGFINKEYSQLAKKKKLAQMKYLHYFNIDYTTYKDFYTKYKDNMRDRISTVLNNLVNSRLIYTPNKIYAIKYTDYADHFYIEETDNRHEIIARCSQHVLQTEFGVTDFNRIRMSETKKKKYNKLTVELINQVFKKLDGREIEFFYMVTEIKGIDEAQIINACSIDDVKNTLKTLNEKVVENLISCAVEENAKEINKVHASKLAEIEHLKEEDYDSYYDLCEEFYWETLDEYGSFLSPESEWLFKGNRGKISYIEEFKKLTELLILQNEEELEKNSYRIIKGDF